MNDELISVRFVIGDADRGSVTVHAEGPSGSPALAEVTRAAEKALGRPFGIDIPSRLLAFPVEADYWEDLGEDYVEIPGDVTFADLAQIVGPDGYSVRLQHDGFGGDGFLFDGFTAWTLSELIEFGRDALEIWELSKSRTG